MFEDSLKQKFRQIFGIKKVTFDMPSDSQEQECLFIEIETATNRFKNKTVLSKVEGTLTMFCQVDKVPFGFFSKKIEMAKNDLTKDLFFYGFEDSKGTFQNIDMRTVKFIYLFDSQYNPEMGTLVKVTVEGE